MENRMLRCMLLNTALPSELVIASHLFRRKNEYLSRKLMGFDSIDDVKNGLLLFKPLEHAFDHFQISFIYDKGSNEFRLKVFDPSLRRQRLITKLHPDQRDLVLNIQTTFGDVEGQPLVFIPFSAEESDRSEVDSPRWRRI
ncbi:HNH endonuclease [Phytophthora infestans]|uniref:HNH endonuclease n=1 Tax=Phytophthora infestans TaxID=4787 RepID=A0A833ST66_PHYIN|nr:HNH endonuclease [Phytophthora infestans]